MNKSKSLKEAKSNRELFFLSLKEFGQEDDYLRNDLYTLLIKANNFSNYSELVLKFNEPCLDENKFFLYLKEFKEGKPIEYITNEAYFLDIKLFVDESVLIPRMETAEMASLILKRVKELNIKTDTIVDCCTGSGCLALFAKKNFKNSKVYASDISRKALKVAKKNADTNEFDITFLEGDKLEPILKENIKCDLFISNPPYVRDYNDLSESVKKYEPINAIMDENGISFYEEFFKFHRDFLNEKYMMAFEINYDEEDELTELINKYFTEFGVNYEFIRDSFSRTRFLFIYRGY